jgi:dienelactone hydrolase
MGLSFFCFGTREGRSQTHVDFPTEDGWTIRGDLFLPKTFPAVRVPGVVLLSEPGWTERSMYGDYLVAELEKVGIVSLAIDMRGTGRTLGKKDFVNFSPKEIDGFQQDIKAAIKFLASQKNVDPQRIGIVGPGLVANYAVLEASENPAVQAVVLISGTLSAAARDYIKGREGLPILYLAGEDDKPSVKEMADAYSESKSEDSGFMMAWGHGTNIFPLSPEPQERIAEWLSNNLAGLGIQSEVSFRSQDGWTLHGILHMPQGADKRSPVAGVVLAHGARHDQQTYYYLARDLVKKGLAVLTFDWRGKGRSTDDEKWIFSGGNIAQDPQIAKLYLDVRAATEFLATQEGVDPSRIGLLGATWSTIHVVLAAVGDPRIKTIVLLTAYGASLPEIKQYLTTSNVPILVVASLDDASWRPATGGKMRPSDANKQIYLFSKSKYSQFLVYTRAGHGSEMFHRDPELQPTIVRWFTEKLDPDWLKNLSSLK